MAHWATGLSGAKQKSVAYDKIYAILYKGKKEGSSPLDALRAIEDVVNKTQQKLYPIASRIAKTGMVIPTKEGTTLRT